MSEARSGRTGHPAETDVIRSFTIPPRPALLMAVQREMAKETPDLDKVVELVSRDSAMAANLLRTANSALFSPRQRVVTVPQAVMLIGTNQCAAIMTGLITRRVLANGHMMMARFWDVSEKRAKALSFLAKELRTVSSDLAYSFGLFCDIGIPLMKAQYPTYQATLSLANQAACEQFLDAENARHGIHHAEIGALLAEKWGIALEVAMAIRLHHSPQALLDASLPAAVKALAASNFLAEKAIQAYRGDTASLEWREGGESACAILALSAAEADALCQEMQLRITRHD